MLNKKGLLELPTLPLIVMFLVVIGLLLNLSLRIEGNLRDDFTTGSTEYNVTDNAMESLSNIGANQGLVGTIIIFSVIISLVMIAFAFGGGAV